MMTTEKLEAPKAQDRRESNTTTMGNMATQQQLQSQKEYRKG